MSLSKRERVLLIVVALLAVAALYIMFYFKPFIETYNETQDEIDTLLIEQNTLNQQNAQTENLLTQVNSLDAQLAQYGDGVTHAFDQPAVLVYLSDTVNQYAQKNTITFEYAAQTGTVEQYSIRVTLITTYDGLKQLLAALDDAPYMMRISAMSAFIYEPLTTVAADDALDTTDTTNDPTGATPPQGGSLAAPDPELISVDLQLNFYCLSNPLPEDADYTFDTPRQYGGDIFY